jgi:hypothetical protein
VNLKCSKNFVRMILSWFSIMANAVFISVQLDDESMPEEVAGIKNHKVYEYQVI